jgi:hypothetical protein
MHEPYTFGISEIEAKTRFGNSFFWVKICHHLIMFGKFSPFFPKQVIKFHPFKTFLGKVK